ncbi:MAG: hypothetical protein ABI315_02165 [Bacteroidia bacterium]
MKKSIITLSTTLFILLSVNILIARSLWSNSANVKSITAGTVVENAFLKPAKNPLKGNYTIGGVSPDFLSINAAATNLKENGV